MTNEEAIKILRRRCCEGNACFGVLCEDCAVTKAFQALEKQTPKPLEHKKVFVHFYRKKMKSPQCPVCGNDYVGTLYHGCNYCDICGQKLDWGDKDGKR